MLSRCWKEIVQSTHMMSSALSQTVTVVAETAAAAAADHGAFRREEARRAVDGINRETDLPSFSVRKATLDDVAAMTVIINQAYDHHKQIFTRAGTTRVATDGSEGGHQTTTAPNRYASTLKLEYAFILCFGCITS